MATINGTPGNDVLATSTAGNTINAGAGNDHVTLVLDSSADGGDGDDLLVMNLQADTTSLSFAFTDGGSSPYSAIGFYTYVHNFESFQITTGLGNDYGYFKPSPTPSVWGADAWNAGAGIDYANLDLTDFQDGITAGFINANTYQLTSNGVVIITLYNIEQLSLVAGAYGPQVNTNTITGTSGNDTLYGFADANFISGGGGEDVLLGQGGTLDGGSGDDIVLAPNAPLYLFSGGTAVTFNNDGTITLTDSAGSTLLKNIETVRMGNNTYVQMGTLGNDTATTSLGSDMYMGGPGDDTVTIGSGNCIVDGGDGNDTVLFASPISSYTIGRNSKGDVTVSAATGYVTTLVNIETVKFNGVTTIFGSDGDDTLTGTGVDEVLFGGIGNDTLNGGGGNDTAAFSGSYNDSTITFNPDGSYTVTGPDGADTLRNIESVKFSDETARLGTGGNDTVTLTGFFDGRQGVGFAGGPGNDTVTANTGQLFFDGGAGTDTIIIQADYANFTATPQGSGVEVGLARLRNVEIVKFNNGTATLSNGQLIFTAAQPVLLNNTGTVSISLVDLPSTLAPQITLSNPSGSLITGAVVKIASGFVEGDILAVSVAGTNIGASYNRATGALTLSGADTAAHYQQALRSVQLIASATPDNSPSSGSITWQVTNSDASHNVSALFTSPLSLPGSGLSGQLNEATFMSGVYPNGQIAPISYRTWKGDAPPHYDSLYSGATKWGSNTAGTSGGTVSYYFDTASNWTATEQAVVSAGLALWSAVANINFVVTTNPDAGITFVRGNDGGAGTTRDSVGGPNAGRINTSNLWQIASATVSIDTSVEGFGPIGDFSTSGGYPIGTVLHEQGHALGLAHSGPYNAGVVAHRANQFGIYDSMLWTLMSYGDPEDPTTRYYSSYNVTGTSWGVNSPTTPMMLDVQAIQLLYGAPVNTPLSGGQVYGFNTNITGAIRRFFDFTQNTNPVVTLWNMGPNNTLDLSGFSTNSTVNLKPGSFSSCDGMINNISIAYNTKIDRFIGGLGDDAVIANNNGNTLFGGGGSDIFTGGYGNDTLNGGLGLDKAVYSGKSTDYTITRNLDGTVTITGMQGADTLTRVELAVFTDQAIVIGTGVGPEALADFDGQGASDLLWQNTGGQAALWLLNGAVKVGAAEVGSNPGASWHIRDSGDFNGDGNADILWQNDSGQTALWIMNGAGIAGSAEVGSNPGASWRVAAAGDFNGDGKSDILFQNKDGRTAIWMMNGTVAGVSGLVAADNPGKSCRVVGTGDFNGDFKSDILFQRSNGDIAIWLMDGLGVKGSAILSPSNPTLHVAAIGDFNGDFKADILWQSDTGQASIWNMDGLAHTGGGALAINPGASWHIVGTGTYDTGNNKLDILWQNDNGDVTSWYMDNTTRLGGDDLAAPGANWKIANSGIASPVYQPGDFDGDGKSDLLWQHNDGTAAVWTMSGASKIGGDELAPKPGSAWHVIGAGDFDGDAKADVLWQHDDGTAAVWLMNGAAKIGGDTISPNPGNAWHVKAAGDFNDDGKADILWQHNDGTVAVWTMNGATRTGGDIVSSNPGASWQVIGSGDFNGDGKADILFQNTDGRAGVWLVNGTSLLAGTAIADNPGTTWHVKGSGDFDGDGKSDILWQNDDGRAAIWLMNGTGVAATGVLPPSLGAGWSVKGAQDLNGDGKSDILFQNMATGEASVSLMSGLTRIGGGTIAPIPGNAWHLMANAG